MSTTFFGCQPVSQCCCGCSLEFGTKVFLVLNFIRSAVYVFIGADNILHVPTEVTLVPEGGRLDSMLVLVGWGITGAMLSVIGLWGVVARMDTALRACWFFLAIAFVVDICSNIFENWSYDGCHDLGVRVMASGRPLLCGAERVFRAVVLVLTTVVEGYAVYIVHCHCEDLMMFAGLDKSFKRLYDVSEVGQGRDYHKLVSDHLNSVNSKVGDSYRIYGTGHHLEYPPVTSMAAKLV